MKRSPLIRKTRLRTYAPLRSRKRMNRVSAKRRRRNAEWSAVTRAAIAAGGGICRVWAILSPEERQIWNVTREAADGHHIAGRGAGMNIPENCLPVSRGGHDWIHHIKNRERALELGFLKFRLRASAPTS
jgi:hypothetical protein